MGIFYKLGKPFRSFANKYEAKHRKPLPYKALAVVGSVLVAGGIFGLYVLIADPFAPEPVLDTTAPVFLNEEGEAYGEDEVIYKITDNANVYNNTYTSSITIKTDEKFVNYYIGTTHPEDVSPIDWYTSLVGFDAETAVGKTEMVLDLSVLSTYTDGTTTVPGSDELVYVMVMDSSGNYIGNYLTIYVDNDTPEFSYTYEDINILKGAASDWLPIELPTIDNSNVITTNVNKIYYNNTCDESNVITGSTEAVKLAAARSHLSTTNGRVCVKYQTIDSAGNVASTTINYISVDTADQVAPILDPLDFVYLNTTNGEITITADKNFNAIYVGTDSAEYTYGNFDNTLFAGGSVNEIVLSSTYLSNLKFADGDVVYIRVHTGDAYSSALNFTVDIVAPTIEDVVDTDVNTASADNWTVPTVNAPDSTSVAQITNVEYFDSGCSTQNTVNDLASARTQLKSKDSSVCIRYTATDEAGNTISKDVTFNAVESKIYTGKYYSTHTYAGGASYSSIGPYTHTNLTYSFTLNLSVAAKHYNFNGQTLLVFSASGYSNIAIIADSCTTDGDNSKKVTCTVTADESLSNTIQNYNVSGGNVFVYTSKK